MLTTTAYGCGVYTPERGCKVTSIDTDHVPSDVFQSLHVHLGHGDLVRHAQTRCAGSTFNNDEAVKSTVQVCGYTVNVFNM